MTSSAQLRHQFVEYIPERLEEGMLYVTVQYATVVHLCCCGCGHEVVTPLSPTDWKLTFDGESVSLNPSIGNWGFACRSHYWIRRNQVQWAEAWSEERVSAGRQRDREAKERHFEQQPQLVVQTEPAESSVEAAPPPREGLVQRLKRWILGSRAR